MSVTENWSGREWTRGESATRVFVVTGEATAADAVAAVRADAVDVGDAYPDDARLLANVDPGVRLVGPAGPFEVRWRYIRADQGQINDLTPDPLDEKPKFRWSSGSFTLPTDVDAYDFPLVNTAGFPLETDIATEISYRILTVTKNVSAYSVATAIDYENYINDDIVAVPTAGNVAPGQLLLKSIEPTHEYDEDATYVNVAYTLWMWRGFVQDSDGYWDSWKYRVLNQARSGWYDVSGTKYPGNFVDKAGELITEPVLLAANGTPYVSGKYFVGEANRSAAVTPPTPTATITEDTGSAVFLKFYKAKFRALAGLTIFS